MTNLLASREQISRNRPRAKDSGYRIAHKSYLEVNADHAYRLGKEHFQFSGIW